MFRCQHMYIIMVAAAAVVVAVKPPTEIVSIYYHMIPTNWLFTYHGCVLILIPLIF